MRQRIFSKNISLAFTALAFGTACLSANAGCREEVRLDKPGGTMDRIPVLAQDGTETCYAYAAGQLADAFRHRTVRQLLAAGKITNDVAEPQLKHITSPLVVAVNTSYEANQDTVNQGVLTKAIRSIFKNGSCSHERIGDQFGAYDSQQFLAQLKEYFNAMRDRRPGTPIARPPSPLDCCTEAQDPGAPLSRRSLEKYLQAPNYLSFLKQTFEAACRRFTLTGPTADLQVYSGPGEANPSVRRNHFAATLADSLKSNTGLPIAINYCADVLYDRDVAAVGSDGSPKNCNINHSSVIVGKRPGPGGSCQYLIRNSMGVSTNGYDWPAERGQIWVDESALLKNLTATVVIE